MLSDFFILPNIFINFIPINILIYNFFIGNLILFEIKKFFLVIHGRRILLKCFKIIIKIIKILLHLIIVIFWMHLISTKVTRTFTFQLTNDASTIKAVVDEGVFFCHACAHFSKHILFLTHEVIIYWKKYWNETSY